jgi:hypothetical protein
MNLRERIASIVGYGRELAGSGLRGASKGRAAFLNGGPISPFFADVNKKALKLATLGACIGALGGYLGRKHQPAARTIAYGALGGAVGFAAGFAWSSHTFAESVARGAMTNVAATRDQHWLKRHPIDYA